MAISPKNDPRRRVFKASKNAEAAITLTDKSVQLVGNKDNFIAVDDTGIYLRGAISFISGGFGVRKGGLFVQLPDFTRMIPSTILTPLPQQIPLPPLQGLNDIRRDLGFFLALMVWG